MLVLSILEEEGTLKNWKKKEKTRKRNAQKANFFNILKNLISKRKYKKDKITN